MFAVTLADINRIVNSAAVNAYYGRFFGGKSAKLTGAHFVAYDAVNGEIRLAQRPDCDANIFIPLFAEFRDDSIGVAAIVEPETKRTLYFLKTGKVSAIAASNGKTISYMLVEVAGDTTLKIEGAARVSGILLCFKYRKAGKEKRRRSLLWIIGSILRR